MITQDMLKKLTDLAKEYTEYVSKNFNSPTPRIIELTKEIEQEPLFKIKAYQYEYTICIWFDSFEYKAFCTNVEFNISYSEDKFQQIYDYAKSFYETELPKIQKKMAEIQRKELISKLQDYENKVEELKNLIK